MILLALLLTAGTAEPACPAPASWSVPKAGGDRPIANIVRFERGSLSWNHVPIDDKTLQLYLLRVKTIEPQPQLVVDTASVDCATLARIAALAQRADLPCENGLCVATTLVESPLAPAPTRPGSR